MRALFLILLPFGAEAACPQETFLSCPVGNGDYLEVCITGDQFSYSYGPEGMPDLSLTVPMAAGTVTPWSGIGSSIWSSVGFPNGGFTYEAWASIDKNPQAPNPSGGVNVLKGEELIAERTCQQGTASTPAFVLEDAMAAQGFCWDFDARVWVTGSCG
jgi:hypothetical protein